MLPELAVTPEERTRHGRYYSSVSVGRVLAERFIARRPNIVIDLGAGGGELSFAVDRRWKPKEIVTVDIDPRCATRMAEYRDAFNAKLRHVQIDALVSDLPDRIGIRKRTVDMAVCNPPYIKPRWREKYGHLLEEVGLSGAFSVVSDIGSDALFLAQNLRMLRPGGHLGLVVPDGFITGKRHSGLRSALVRDHCIESVVSLPRDVFRSTEVQAHVLIMRANVPQVRCIELLELTSSGCISDAIRIAPDEAIARLDYKYYRNCTGSQGQRKRAARITTLAALGASAVRGSYSSAAVRLAKHHIFHTSDFPLVPGRSIRLPMRKADVTRKPFKGKTIARAGDILIARVDRKLEQKICIVRQGFGLVSDCVLRLRVPKRWRGLVVKQLASAAGRDWLVAVSSGVAARLLTKNDLLTFSVVTEAGA